MKRDLNLWRLLLLELRDGVEPEELRKYEEPLATYNAALLVNGGYVHGVVVPDIHGNPGQVKMLQLTNEGHDLLERLETKTNGVTQNTQMPATEQKLSIFISHSAKDEKLAEALIALLRNALTIPSDKIRCTSVNGYRLPVGAETGDQLRQEVHDAKAFIGLITPASIASAYVMFELGARWGARLHLAPLLGAGAGTDHLRGPLSSLNALRCEDAAQLHQLITDLAKLLKVDGTINPASYQNLIDELISISKSETTAAVGSKAAPAPAPPVETPLASAEVQILKLFQHATSGWDTDFVATFGENLKLHRLVIQQALDKLVGREMLLREYWQDGKIVHWLDVKGRDYLIEHNLLG